MLVILRQGAISLGLENDGGDAGMRCGGPMNWETEGNTARGVSFGFTAAWVEADDLFRVDFDVSYPFHKEREMGRARSLDCH